MGAVNKNGTIYVETYFIDPVSNRSIFSLCSFPMSHIDGLAWHDKYRKSGSMFTKGGEFLLPESSMIDVGRILQNSGSRECTAGDGTKELNDAIDLVFGE